VIGTERDTGVNMLKQTIIIACLFTTAALSVSAQGFLEGTRLRLVDDGQTYGGILIPPTPAGPPDIIFNLPAVGGQFLVDDGSGKSAWLVGGQALTSTGLIGSTTAFDVQLVAGPATTPRAIVSATTNAVSLPDQTELRFYEPVGSGTNYTAFKADVQANNIALMLPAVVGPAGAWLGIAAAPAPTATSATLTWISPP